MSIKQWTQAEDAKRKYGVRSTNPKPPKKPSLKKRLAKSAKRQQKRIDWVQGRGYYNRSSRYQQSSEGMQGNLLKAKPDKVFGKVKKVSSSTKPTRRVRLGTRRQR